MIYVINETDKYRNKYVSNFLKRLKCIYPLVINIKDRNNKIISIGFKSTIADNCIKHNSRARSHTHSRTQIVSYINFIYVNLKKPLFELKE